MKFSELKGPGYFVVIMPDNSVSPILSKDGRGKIRNFKTYVEVDMSEITEDTEVQPVCLSIPPRA